MKRIRQNFLFFILIITSCKVAIRKADKPIEAQSSELSTDKEEVDPVDEKTKKEQQEKTKLALAKVDIFLLFHDEESGLNLFDMTQEQEDQAIVVGLAGLVVAGFVGYKILKKQKIDKLKNEFKESVKLDDKLKYGNEKNSMKIFKAGEVDHKGKKIASIRHIQYEGDEKIILLVKRGEKKDLEELLGKIEKGTEIAIRNDPEIRRKIEDTDLFEGGKDFGSYVIFKRKTT